MICNKQAESGPTPDRLREAEGALRANGNRITGQRALVMSILMESGGDHLDAHELYQRARERDPRINLATVYRTLGLLKRAWLVEHGLLRSGQRREQFEPRPDSDHYHFSCIRCGRVIEFGSRQADRLRRETERQLGVKLTRASVVFEGYCPECAAGNP